MKCIASVFKRVLDWRHRHFIVSGNRFRRNRWQFFADNLLADNDVILDVGYGYGQFEDQMQESGRRNKIIALDITSRNVSRHVNVVAFVMADASFLPLADRSLDIIYSNSLLEHLEGWNFQERAFGEFARVGKKFFVQTPNRHFPIEAHHLVPFFQYLPSLLQHWIGKNLLGHFEPVRLLNRKEIGKLVALDENTSIFEEKAFGLTKSFVLYRRKVSPEKDMI